MPQRALSVLNLRITILTTTTPPAGVGGTPRMSSTGAPASGDAAPGAPAPSAAPPLCPRSCFASVRWYFCHPSYCTSPNRTVRCRNVKRALMSIKPACSTHPAPSLIDPLAVQPCARRRRPCSHHIAGHPGRPRRPTRPCPMPHAWVACLVLVRHALPPQHGTVPAPLSERVTESNSPRASVRFHANQHYTKAQPEPNRHSEGRVCIFSTPPGPIAGSTCARMLVPP